jgi:Calcineurin-like phosphoesterase
MKNITGFFLSLASMAFAPHLRAEDLKLGIIGDAGQWNSNSESVQKSLIRRATLKLIMPGDNLYVSTYADVWGHWSTKGFSFDVVAIGNHTAGYSKETQFFGMPGEYFSKVQGTSRFIVLNSDNVTTASAQAAFLESELNSAHEPFIFLVYHHPTYTLSSTHHWDEKKAFQTALRPLLKRFRSKITAVIVGHDHLAVLAHFGDLPVILSGAVKDVRVDTPIDGIQDGVAVAADWYFDGSPYWVQLLIPAGAAAATVDFIRASDDQVSCTATIVTGKAAALSANCSQRRPSQRSE